MRRTLTVLALVAAATSVAACGKKDGTAKAPAKTTTAAAHTATTAAPAGRNGCQAVAPAKVKRVALSKPSASLDPKKTWTVTLKTNCGSIQIQLDVKRSPKTSASFAYLVRKGFYDGLSFHRIAQDQAGNDFVIQGGDPTGTGDGDAGYRVVEPPPSGVAYTRGVVAMAKTEIEKAGTSGSQFFIVTAPDSHLDPLYALAGKVVGGGDAVKRIAAVATDPNTDGRPLRPVVIEKATLSSR